MHRPVAAPLAIFAGAVERIDDPHARLVEAGDIIAFLLGEQPVAGARGAAFPAQHRIGGLVARLPERLARSEEHTSELQSLMRISYAVFCLKKTNIHISTTHHQSKNN